jgi:hypothetical protein
VHILSDCSSILTRTDLWTLLASNNSLAAITLIYDLYSTNKIFILPNGNGMQYLTRQGIGPPYNRKHDDTDRCYQLIVLKILNLLLALPLHHPLVTWPSGASFTRLYNSNLNIGSQNTYIFPRREYNYITAYTRTPQINTLRHHYHNTPWHTHIRVLIQFSHNLYFQTYSSHKTSTTHLFTKHECDLATA